MKQRSSWLMKEMLILGVFFIFILIRPDTCFADQAGSKPEGIMELKKDTVYEYDLNGDGKAEKLQYKVTVDDVNYTAALELYINDKLYLSRKDYVLNYTIDICDINKSDNYLDLYCYSTVDDGCIYDGFFARYDGEKLIDKVKFPLKTETKDISRFSLDKTDGNGKFTVCMDTPVFSYTIGCYYCYVPYQLKNNKITRVPVNTYSFNKYSKNYKYKVKKSFSVYDKAGSKTVAFKVNKGEKVTFDQLYLTKYKKAYFRIRNHNGKTGWIKSEKKNLFSILPMWG